jgi:hypothetical protein
MRNFYATNGGLFLEETIPNCYFLQNNLDAVLADWDGQGTGVGDPDTFNTYVWWGPTDPAYGCYSDLATVTATNFNDGPTPLPTTGQNDTAATVATSTTPTCKSLRLGI